VRLYREYVRANFSSNSEHFEQAKNYIRYWLAKNNCADAIDFLENARRPSPFRRRPEPSPRGAADQT
jgi:hypothetical protein